jgi:hypothetical protein
MMVTPPSPMISVTPPSPFDFGNVQVHQPKTQTFTIANTGQADLLVASTTLSGDAASA